MLSSVVVGQVFSVFLRSDGPINRVAEQLGMGTDVAWLGDAGTALPSILAVIVWREIGLGAQILRELGVSSIRNLATGSRSYVGLSGFGIEIVANELV